MYVIKVKYICLHIIRPSWNKREYFIALSRRIWTIYIGFDCYSLVPMLIKDYWKLNIWHMNFYLICQAWETKLVAIFPNALFRFYNIVRDFLYLCIILKLTCINLYRLNITFVPIILTYCTRALIIFFLLIKCMYVLYTIWHNS
jgi:hypothetical protein